MGRRANEQVLNALVTRGSMRLSNLSYHGLVGPTDVCKECDELALWSEEGWGEGRVQRVQLLWVRTSVVTELVID